LRVRVQRFKIRMVGYGLFNVGHILLDAFSKRTYFY
jgi:hypothetical protein